VTKDLMVNPLKTHVMVFTRKQKPEPIKALENWGKRNCLHLLGEVL